jgi:hypothetical protein
MEARALSAVNALAERQLARALRRQTGAGSYDFYAQLVFRNGVSSSRCLKAFSVDCSSMVAGW